ncbi:MAG: hypothetical protein JNJ48_07915 [Phycisphaerae bacterium]|nr:hypothetical protein [Phycisphaerae bacterium]
MAKKVAADQAKQKKVVLFLLVVIVAALGLVIYQVVPKGNPNPTIQPENPTEAWIAAAVKQFTDLRWELVTVKAKDDGSGVEVGGKVPSAKDLTDLKAMLETLEPKVAIAYSVTVGR